MDKPDIDAAQQAANKLHTALELMVVRYDFDDIRLGQFAGSEFYRTMDEQIRALCKALAFCPWRFEDEDNNEQS